MPAILNMFEEEELIFDRFDIFNQYTDADWPAGYTR
jgi:hypothetical protein